jgi:BirA family biotin operon repressor/biotin-[acetyl-CoA-carboxylase] ligase
VVDRIDSTMTWMRQQAAEGQAEGTSILADEQTQGRGRHGREWQSPPGAGVQASILVRPEDRPLEALGMLPLLVGLGIADRIVAAADVLTAVKWPNDVVVENDRVADGAGERSGVTKLAGILAERLPDGAVIIGVGLNATTPRDSLPGGATSLLVEGSSLSREQTAVEVLDAIAVAYRHWSAGEFDMAHYRERCVTLGRSVMVHEVDAGSAWRGVAMDIDETGRLLVRRSSGDGRDALGPDTVAVASGED